MKQKLLLMVMSCLCFVTVFAQNRTITGRVTGSNDGQPIPGVTVKVIGSNIATSTNSEGRFTLSINPGAKALNFSSIGFTSLDIQIGELEVVNASLTESANTLTEIVVTGALGVNRTQRSVSTAQQQLSAEKISPTKIADLNTAIAGKIAGVQMSGGSGAKFGTSTIRLRGINSLNGSNPIYVVDGVITNSQGINPEDVETLNVLKGPAATALYGQRGSEGAIVITTKKGSKNGIGIDISHSTTFESVYVLPNYQNEYAGGYSQEWDVFNYDPATMPSYLSALDGAKYHIFYGDESWGPKMDGTLYAPWYAFDPTDPDFGKLQSIRPQPNNIRDFYEIGNANNTTLSLSKVNETSNTRFSFTNLTRKGVSPNSNQQKNWLLFNNRTDLTKQLNFSTNVNYVYEKRFNTPVEGYGAGAIGSFNQWFHRDVEINKLKRYKRPDGTYTTWNINDPTNLDPVFWNNPYTEAFENTNTNYTSRLYGNAAINYDFGAGFSASVTARGSFVGFNSDAKIASFTVAQESFSVNSQRLLETSYLANIAYDKTFGDFNVKASIYGELMTQDNNNISGATNGGFITPNLYNLSNSLDNKIAINTFIRKKVNSIYGYSSFGYKNFLYLDLNLRNDVSSSLPSQNNSYLYGGISGSFVFSEFTKNAFSALSFGKLRASLARVGTDVAAYNIVEAYPLGNPYTKPSGASATTYGVQTVPNTRVSEDLKPSLSTSYEIGLELRFLRDRIRGDFNYYYRNSKDQIITVGTPPSTGYRYRIINAGSIENKGFEMTLGGTPIKSKNINWDVDFNLAFNRNLVVSLASGVDNIQGGIDGSSSFFGFNGSPIVSLNARVGKASGFINGNGILKDSNGNRLVGDDGYYLTQENMDIGSILPDFTGGFATGLTYKKFSLNGSLDFQKGGKFLSVSKQGSYGAGLAEETVGLNDKGFPKRDPVANGGGIVLPGVNSTTGLPNTKYVDIQDLYELHMSNVWENWVYDASYIKLREISLGYEMPKSLFKRLPIKSAKISLVGQNLWLIYSKVKGIDPSELEQSWTDTGQLPGTRTIGFNLKLSL